MRVQTGEEQKDRHAEVWRRLGRWAKKKRDSGRENKWEEWVGKGKEEGYWKGEWMNRLSEIISTVREKYMASVVGRAACLFPASQT